MNYPSTTQALFALIVMIIVLLFILVYCCWGTLSCARQEEAAPAPTTEETPGANTQQGMRHILRGPHTVIVPINNMIYVGDPETHQIYQIPLDRDKPPAYTEVFRTGPPPPYISDTAASNSSELTSITTTTYSRDQQASRASLPESPPAYEECLSTPTQELETVMSLDTAENPTQLQQQQLEGAAGSESPTDTAASASTPPTVPEARQDIHESPSPITENNLPAAERPRDPLQGP